MIDSNEIIKKFNLPRLLPGKPQTVTDLEVYYEADIKDGLYDSGDLDPTGREAVWFLTKAIVEMVNQRELAYTLFTRPDGTYRDVLP